MKRLEFHSQQLQSADKVWITFELFAISTSRVCIHKKKRRKKKKKKKRTRVSGANISSSSCSTVEVLMMRSVGGVVPVAEGDDRVDNKAEGEAAEADVDGVDKDARVEDEDDDDETKYIDLFENADELVLLDSTDTCAQECTRQHPDTHIYIHRYAGKDTHTHAPHTTR